MPLGTLKSSRSHRPPRFARLCVCLFPCLLSILQLPKCSICLPRDLLLLPFHMHTLLFSFKVIFTWPWNALSSVHTNPSGLAGHSLKRSCHLGGQAAKADLSGHFSGCAVRGSADRLGRTEGSKSGSVFLGHGRCPHAEARGV